MRKTSSIYSLIAHPAFLCVVEANSGNCQDEMSSEAVSARCWESPVQPEDYTTEWV